MKLLGDIQSDGIKSNFLQEDYATDISLSLQDVTSEDARKLCDTIESSVYTWGILGYHNSRENMGRDFEADIHLVYSPKKKNEVQLAYYKNTKRANVFIKGPKAELIVADIRKLIPEESLENLALV